MKKVLLLIIANLFCLLTFAQTGNVIQTNDEGGYVSLTIGPSYPSGDFASTDPTNPSAGFAKTGVIVDFSFAYKIGQNFGLAALIRGQANPINAQALVNQLSQLQPNNYGWAVSADPWSVGCEMAGLYGSFPMDATSIATFDIRVLIGLVSATAPQISIDGYNSSGATSFDQAGATANAFAYLIGAGIKYRIAGHFDLLANVDYLACKPQFNNVLITETSPTNTNSYTNSFSQSLGTISLGFGLAYSIR